MKKAFFILLTLVLFITSVSIPVYADESVSYTFDYLDLEALYAGGYLSGGTVSSYGTLATTANNASGFYSFFALSGTSSSVYPYIIFDISSYNSSATLTKVSADVNISYATGITHDSNLYVFSASSVGSGTVNGYLYSTNSYNDSSDSLSLVSSITPSYTNITVSPDSVSGVTSSGSAYLFSVAHTVTSSSLTFASQSISDDYVAIAYGWSSAPTPLGIVYGVESVTFTFTTDSTDALLNQINQTLINGYETLLDINQNISSSTTEITNSISVSTETIENKISDLQSSLTEETEENSNVISEMEDAQDEALSKFDDYLTAEEETLSQDDIDSASSDLDSIFEDFDEQSEAVFDIQDITVFSAYLGFFDIQAEGFVHFVAPLLIIALGLWLGSYILFGKSG